MRITPSPPLRVSEADPAADGRTDQGGEAAGQDPWADGFPGDGWESTDPELPLETPRRGQTPLWALAALVAALILRPWDYVPALQALRPVTLSILGVSALALACGVRMKFLSLPLGRALLALWLVMVATTPFSYSVSPSAELAIKYAQQLALFAVFGSLVVATDGLYRLAWVLSLAGGVLGAVAIQAYLSGAVGIDARILGVGQGLTSDPNDLANTLVTLMPLSFFSLAYSDRLSTRLIAGASALANIAGGVVATQSRGGLVSLAAGALILVVMSRKNAAGRLTVFAAAAAGCYAIAPSDATERYSTIADVQSDESAMSRLAVWRAGGRMLADHPLTGVGMGQFAEVYGQHYLDREGAGAVWRAAHNSVVEVAAELGLLGLGCWLALVVGSVVVLLRSRSILIGLSEGDPATERLIGWCSALTASWVGFVTGAMFLSRAYDITLLLLVCLMSATTAIVHRWCGAIDEASLRPDSPANASHLA